MGGGEDTHAAPIVAAQCMAHCWRPAGHVSPGYSARELPRAARCASQHERAAAGPYVRSVSLSLSLVHQRETTAVGTPGPQRRRWPAAWKKIRSARPPCVLSVIGLWTRSPLGDSAWYASRGTRQRCGPVPGHARACARRRCASTPAAEPSLPQVLRSTRAVRRLLCTAAVPFTCCRRAGPCRPS